MVRRNISPDDFIMRLEVKLGIDYTEEQKELIKSFGNNVAFCFASPGTGKTQTAIAGLIYAEGMCGIPGENIYALSFTKLATSELSVRTEVACKKLGMHKDMNFATLHKLCKDILDKNYSKLGMSKFDVDKPLTMAKAFELISSSCEDLGISMNPNQIKACVRACSSLNSALIFDRDIVESKMAFKECRVDYDDFDKVRGLLFAYSLLTESITVSDLLLYTVMLLTRFPEVSDEFKSKCKVMLVDEAQDLTLLQLKVISMLTDNVILIGDMKQQIYGFNGACQEVVQEFHKLYPDCRDLKLTQSFRCRNEIAEFATKIILHNNIGGEDYKGIGDGGSVNILPSLYENGLDIKGLCSKLHDEYIENRRLFPKTYLFLTRTNFSLLPIIEELYNQGLPFQVNNYVPAYRIPLIRELCELLYLVEQPYNCEYVTALQYLIPEFKGYQLKDHPYYKICKKTGCSIYEINYEFKNPAIAGKAMNLLLHVSEMLKAGEKVGKIFNTLWPMFNENYVQSIVWRLEASPEYYTSCVSHLVDKNFAKFIQDEIQKIDIIKECNTYGRGIRCYTMHGSKGLEADVVYIIDADEGLIPNTKKIANMVDKKCDLDAARAIREERALCYVACTRARTELNIVYNNDIAPMFMGINTFHQFDDVYRYYRPKGDDILAFTQFTERYIK